MNLTGKAFLKEIRTVPSLFIKDKYGRRNIYREKLLQNMIEIKPSLFISYLYEIAHEAEEFYEDLQQAFK